MARRGAATAATLGRGEEARLRWRRGPEAERALEKHRHRCVRVEPMILAAKTAAEEGKTSSRPC
jgi:hypothetical protein